MSPEEVTSLMDLLQEIHEQQIQNTQAVCWIVGGLAVILFSSIIKPFQK